MSVTYEELWNQIFTGKSQEFLYAIDILASEANISFSEYKRMLKSLEILNTDGFVHQSDFEHIFTYITDDIDVENFHDSLLFVINVLSGIIDNIGVPLELGTSAFRELHKRQYMVIPCPTREILFEIVYNPGKQQKSNINKVICIENYSDNYPSLHIIYDSEKHTYMSSYRESIVEADPVKFINKLKTLASKHCGGEIFSYRKGVPGDIWSDIIGDVDSISLDIAIDKFTNAIVNHESYKEEDVSGVEYLVLWLQKSEHGKFFIERYDFAVLWSKLGRHTIEKQSNTKPYIGNLAKLIEKIFNCDGFVNAYNVKSLPNSYFCLNKADILEYPSVLIFTYKDEMLETHTIEILYEDGAFSIHKLQCEVLIEDICVLIDIIKLSLTKNSKDCGIILPQSTISNISTVSYKHGIFLCNGEEVLNISKSPQLPTVICIAAKVLGQQKYIKDMPKYDLLVSISSKSATIMYAPWNNGSVRIPSWFYDLEANRKYADTYKKGLPINETSVIKEQLLNTIKYVFGSSTYNFVKKLGAVLVSVTKDSLLPYLIYLAYRKRVAVIEVNNKEKIIVSGYNKLGGRVYESFDLKHSKPEDVINVLKQFEIPIEEDSRFCSLLLDFYVLEESKFYSTGSMERKIDMIKDVVGKYEFLV